MSIFVDEPIEPCKELRRIKDVLSSVAFKDWSIRLYAYTGEQWMQWTWKEEDYINGGTFDCRGRKWKLSIHMTDSELVQTAFLAAKVAMEHEIREAFSYKGRPVMRPHFDVDALIELCDRNAVSKRVETGEYDDMMEESDVKDEADLLTEEDYQCYEDTEDEISMEEGFGTLDWD